MHHCVSVGHQCVHLVAEALQGAGEGFLQLRQLICREMLSHRARLPACRQPASWASCSTKPRRRRREWMAAGISMVGTGRVGLVMNEKQSEQQLESTVGAFLGKLI